MTDRVTEALERQLERARRERRWVDADEIEQQLEEHRAALARTSKVVDLGARRKARG